MADKIMHSGIKAMDARHLACAILAKADCFITVDDRVLKCKEEGIRIITPLAYIEMEGNNEYS